MDSYTGSQTLSEVCDKWQHGASVSHIAAVGKARGQSQHTEDDATEERKPRVMRAAAELLKTTA